VAREGSDFIARQLLNAGADTQSIDQFGFTSLHWYARCGKDRLLPLLLGRSDNALAQNGFGDIAIPWKDDDCLGDHIQRALDSFNSQLNPSPREINDLGNKLMWRFNMSKNLDDLKSPISRLRDAIAESVSWDDGYSMYLYNLARAYRV
jgi:hypothetical protein